MNRAKAKTIRAVVDKPTEDILLIRSIEIGSTKERLIGYILKDWVANATPKSDLLEKAKETLV